jgi:hypothetical protein
MKYKWLEEVRKTLHSEGGTPTTAIGSPIFCPLKIIYTKKLGSSRFFL